MDDYPVKIGNMLFTMVDPNPGFEVAYNRWYERDHFYAGCMIFPGLFAGHRWVAPRDLKDLRFPDPSPVADPLDAGSYLSIYWRHKGMEYAGQDWDGPSVFWLYENGRGFDERTHRHTANYDFVSAAYKDDDGVPVELALDHSYAGLGVVFSEPAEGVSSEELISWLESSAAPVLFAADGPDSICSWVVNEHFRGPRTRESPMALGTAGGRRRPGHAAVLPDHRALGVLGCLPGLRGGRRRRGRGQGHLRRPVPAHHRRDRHVHRPALVGRRPSPRRAGRPVTRTPCPSTD